MNVFISIIQLILKLLNIVFFTHIIILLLIKEMYHTKMKTFLSDSNTHNLVTNKNIIQYIQNKTNELVKELKDLKVVDDNTSK